MELGTLMLNRSAGTSCVKSTGSLSSSHSRDGLVTPPANRQLLPTIAIGSEAGILYDIMKSQVPGDFRSKRVGTAVRFRQKGLSPDNKSRDLFVCTGYQVCAIKPGRKEESTTKEKEKHETK